MVGDSPQRTGGLVAVDVIVGVSVSVMVEVGVIEAVAVAVGRSILFKALQPFTIGRSNVQLKSKTNLLK